MGNKFARLYCSIFVYHCFILLELSEEEENCTKGIKFKVKIALAKRSCAPFFLLYFVSTFVNLFSVSIANCCICVFKCLNEDIIFKFFHIYNMYNMYQEVLIFCDCRCKLHSISMSSCAHVL